MVVFCRRSVGPRPSRVSSVECAHRVVCAGKGLRTSSWLKKTSNSPSSLSGNVWLGKFKISCSKTTHNIGTYVQFLWGSFSIYRRFAKYSSCLHHNCEPVSKFSIHDTQLIQECTTRWWSSYIFLSLTVIIKTSFHLWSFRWRDILKGTKHKLFLFTSPVRFRHIKICTVSYPNASKSNL